jgi:uncharacterized membrane protein
MQNPDNELEVIEQTGEHPTQPREVHISTEGAIHVNEMFLGPLPHPETLAGYNNIVPGSAGLIIDDLMVESTHRRTMEKSAIDNAASHAKSGQNKAFALSMIGMGFGFAVIIASILSNNNVATISGIISGSVLSGLPLVQLVRSFLKNGHNGKG